MHLRNVDLPHPFLPSKPYLLGWRVEGAGSGRGRKKRVYGKSKIIPEIIRSILNNKYYREPIFSSIMVSSIKDMPCRANEKEDILISLALASDINIPVAVRLIW